MSLEQQIQYMRERGTNGPQLVDFLEALASHVVSHFPVVGAYRDGIHDDTLPIQQAINLAEGGGEAYVPAGTYLVSGLKMKTKVRLRGAGRRASILKLKANAVQAVISLDDATVYATEVISLGIDGNRDRQTGKIHGIFYENSGVPIDESGAKHILRDLHVERTSGDAVHLDISDGSCLLDNVYTLHANQKGFYLNVADSTFANCLAGQSGEEGVFLTVRGGNRFMGCKAYRSGRLDETKGTGWFINSHGNQFSGCAAQDNRLHGWDFYGANHNVATAAESESNGFSSTDRGQAAYRLNGAQNNLINGTAWGRKPADLPAGGGNRYSLSLVNSPLKNLVQIAGSDAVTASVNGDVGDNTVAVV